MKNKFLTKILLVLMLAVTAASATACAIGEQKPLNEFLSDKGLNARVTYYANGGTFDGSITDFDRDLYYKGGSPVLNLGKDGNVKVERFGYVLAGWARATLDESGNPVFTNAERGEVKYAEDAVVSFPLNIAENEHLHLVAVWYEDVYVDFKLVTDTPVKGADGVEYNTGDTIKKEFFGTGSSVVVNLKKSPMESTTHTYLQLYTDEDCTTEFDGKSVEKPSDGSNAVMYAKYIPGVYAGIVRDADDVDEMFKNIDDESKKYYVFKDIDCTGAEITAPEYMLAGAIEGNGKKIKNIKFGDITLKATKTETSIFGELVSSANITDLTLENLEVTVTSSLANPLYKAFVLFTDAEEGATLTDFAINGVTLKIKVQNYTVNDSNWLYGGFETDAGFEAKYPGLTITGASYQYI